MPNLYLPVAAAVLSLVILIVYLSKKRMYLDENNLYFGMLIAIQLDSILVSLLFGVLYANFDTFVGNLYLEGIVRLINRIDYVCLFAWSSFLFLYTYIVIFKNDAGFKKKYRTTVIAVASVSVILSVVMWFLDIEIIVVDRIRSTAQGGAVYFSIAACVVYLLASIVMIVCNPKKITKQVLPVFICLVITIIIACLFTVNPYLICVSMGLTVVNLTMYFTIENPDLQMLEKVNAAREEALKANQAKTDFLSSMSHEIRTPLNAIVGFSECILNDESLDKAKNDARDIINASNSLLEIVNGILDISKIEADKMELAEKEYDLLDVATGLAKLVKTRIGEKPIVMSTHFSPDIPGVLFGDEAKIKQIMTNILTNAVKYTDKGTVDFTIDCLNDNDTAHLTIRVEDTGRGIKEELIDNLFEKFNRLDEERNTKIEGTGLGLAITKKLVEMMNGEITVQSEYGRGSVFTIRIPQTIRSMERKTVRQAVQNITTYPDKKVLVVDDNLLNIKVAARMLEKAGINPDTAESGEDCLKMCADNKYDLILLDDMMPKMSGSETLGRLKENPDFDTPVVILTANAIEGMKGNYLDKGFDDYLAKPIEKTELRRVLGKYLG